MGPFLFTIHKLSKKKGRKGRVRNISGRFYFFKIVLAFCKTMDYTGTNKYEQRLQGCKGESQALELNKGMGEAPH